MPSEHRQPAAKEPRPQSPELGPGLLLRHLQALWYSVTVILPLLLRTGKRPVIFSRFAGMGDIIAAFPAALALRKRHPGATFIFNCAGSFACLPVLGGVADRITCLKSIGVVGHWYGFLLAGFYHFGYGDEFPDSASSEITIKEFGRPFGVATGDAHPVLQVDAAALARMEVRLAAAGCGEGEVILVHPGPSWPVRTWPHESWCRLLGALRERGFLHIIQIGASVRAYANAGADDFPPLPGIHSWVDQLTLTETIALISKARLLIGIDSGLIHFAACLRIPAVGIFGPTTPELRFARDYARPFVTSRVACQGCHHRVPRVHWEKGCPHEIRCMKEILPEQVLAACLGILSPKL